MAKEDVVLIPNGRWFSHKKEQIMPFVATWRDLETVILSEDRQRRKNTVSIPCGIQKKKKKKRHKWTYLQNRKKSYRCRKGSYGCQGRKGEIGRLIKGDWHTHTCVLSAQLLSHVWLFSIPWTVACQAPLSVHGVFQARMHNRAAISFLRGSSWSRDPTRIFCISRRILLPQSHREACTHTANKDLLYSIGNSTRYSGMAYTGRESKKEWMYV